MEKDIVTIVVRGGNIEEIISTSDNVQVVIVDHDNLQENIEQGLETLRTKYHPDRLVSHDESDDIIKGVENEYKS